MFDCLDYVIHHGHEQLVFNYDKETGLRALIAIHSTKLGPALGGTRLWCYSSTEDAVLDVLRLSEGMTYKAAAAGLPLGGGKAVILADGLESDPAIRAARFRAFGRFVESLNGRYITAEDVGTTPQDMAFVLENTAHVVGLPGATGDPSPVTAYGVLRGMEAAVEFALNRDSLEGVRVAVQGLGKVGLALVDYLVEAGAQVIATDVRPEALKAARLRPNVRLVAPDEIYDVDCDVFAPCALGGIINDATLPRLRCAVIAGAANNQLEDPDRHSQALRHRDITYVVDYVINAGGLINVSAEVEGYEAARISAMTAGIYNRVWKLLDLADSAGITTHQAAKRMVQEALNAPLMVG
jgi:leucine dehydrogenase